MTAKLAVIGAGNMGAAILRGAVSAAVLKPADILVIEPDDSKRQAMSAIGCATGIDPAAATSCANIMLAVKPQVFPDVAASMKRVTDSTRAISIMAGLSSVRIRSLLGGAGRIVRVMPNTPSQIGCGMAAIALGEGARDGDDLLAFDIFSAIGKVVRVSEDQMHAVTAVSGSGPAYVFLLAEAMEQAGECIGLKPQIARVLAYQTVLGAGQLFKNSNEDAASLRKAVTSPGGTTEAALKVMFERELPDIVEAAITAARDRGMELDRM